MTPDTMRQGAALVRALVEGDETARGPLSDFVEEHGLPGQTPATCATICNILRMDGHFVVTGCKPWPWVGTTQPRGPNAYRLGTWPAWAWEPTTQVTPQL